MPVGSLYIFCFGGALCVKWSC